jgi:glutathione S-transferase
MKLYYSPGACSVGIHIMLEEIGKPYDLDLISVRDGSQFSEAYVAINPKSKIPALRRDDDSVLTEYGAIATWLARTNPDAKLMPTDPDAEARAIEAMDYVVGTMHMQGFARIARPGNFSPNEADKEKVQARGREIFAKGMALMDKRLEGREWIAGEYSLADATLFYVSNWAPRAEVPLPPNVAAHFARLKTRPAVQRTIAAEGLTP